MVTLEDRRTVRELDDAMRSAKTALDRALHDDQFNIHTVLLNARTYSTAYHRHRALAHEILTAQMACTHKWVQVAGSVIQCSECGSSRGD